MHSFMGWKHLQFLRRKKSYPYKLRRTARLGRRASFAACGKPVIPRAVAAIVWLWRLVASVFLAGAAVGCGEDPSPTASEQAKAVEARVETLQAVSLPVYAVQPGTVVPAERVEVSSRLSGYIFDLDIHEGQYVKKDQLLFAVDPTDVKDKIRQAEGALAAAAATLAEADANYERFKRLYREQSATQVEYQDAERNYKVALGNRHAAESALKAARAQLKYAEVRAPFDGLVVDKMADNGQLSSPGTPVLVLQSSEHLRVQVQMDEHAFAHLTLGQRIEIDLQDENLQTQTVTGQVERMVAAANPVTHTHLVKIGLPTSNVSWSGKFVLVRIPVGTHEGIVVPDQAIYHRAGIPGAFVVDTEGRSQFRMVTLGKDTPQGRIVLSGLAPGERLIVSARGALANGMEIQALSEKPP